MAQQTLTPGSRIRTSLFVCLFALLAAAPSQAATLRALTNARTVEADYSAAAVNDAGTMLFMATNLNLDGGDPGPVDQIVKWDLVTGETSYVTNLPGGVTTRPLCAVPCSDAPVVSDDGQWVTFMSNDDPLGTNADGSTELFVIRSDGTDLAQLTDTEPGNDVYVFTMSGSGNRVAFTAAIYNWLLNPDGFSELFVINRDGSGLSQVTVFDRYVGISWLSMSDDGTRITFSSSQDLVAGQNPGAYEVFAVNADGSGLRQVTVSGNGPDAQEPVISGDGEWIAYRGRKNPLGENSQRCASIFLTSYAGEVLTQLSPGCSGDLSDAAQSPSITDDGSVIYYESAEQGALNPDANVEIWRINADGTGKQQLTETTSLGGNARPVVAGGGGNLVFLTQGPFPGGLNPRGDPAVMRAQADGSDPEIVLEQQSADVTYGEYDITADGTRVVFISDDNPLGSNPQRLPQVFRIEADGTGLAQVTGLTGGEVLRVSVTDDGDTIVYSATGSPAGENPQCDYAAGALNGWAHVYVMEADGSNLLDLTPSCGGNHSLISGNGDWVIYQAAENGRLYRVRPDGSELLDLIYFFDAELHRINATGQWIVFQEAVNPWATSDSHGYEIFRMRSDGTDLEQLTESPEYFVHDSRYPDISADGQRISYVSMADPLGTNPDLNWEVFLLDVTSGTLTQLTDTVGGYSQRARISGDGAWVYFDSSHEFFGPATERSPYRVEVATGRVERIGGTAPTRMHYLSTMSMAPDGDGDRVALIPMDGDLNGQNSDGSQEVWLADFSAGALIDVGKDSPTLISWVADPRYVRYDVIRGDVSSLGDDGGTVNLGPVVCVENDSTDTDTAGHEIADAPAPGQVFFFLYRGTQGEPDGPGSYGQGTGGKERVPASGDCLQ